MSALIVVGIVICVAVQFAIGWGLAMRRIPRWFNQARDRTGIEHLVRENVRWNVLFSVGAWPLMLACELIDHINGRIDMAIEARDPRCVERELAEREQRITELERELGIR